MALKVRLTTEFQARVVGDLQNVRISAEFDRTRTSWRAVNRIMARVLEQGNLVARDVWIAAFFDS